jgi:hypothetical protein
VDSLSAKKLGIVGLSEGNGHPFSWSAIFNGYDQKFEKNCNFPVIPKYLSQQQWPNSKIQNASVDGIWTQSQKISKDVAQFSCIPKIFTNLDKLIDSYDYILLARDDCQNHLRFSQRALRRSKHVYIDKPIAINRNGLNQIYSLCNDESLIFSCSAISFCPSTWKLQEALLDHAVERIVLSSPKSWDKYAVHLVDPFFTVLNKLQVRNYSLDLKNIISFDAKAGAFSLTFELGLPFRKSNIELIFETTGRDTGFIGFSAYQSIYDNSCYLSSHHSDSFSCFKKALECFIARIDSKSLCNDHFTYRHHLAVVTLLELPYLS